MKTKYVQSLNWITGLGTTPIEQKGHRKEPELKHVVFSTCVIITKVTEHMLYLPFSFDHRLHTVTKFLQKHINRRVKRSAKRGISLSPAPLPPPFNVLHIGQKLRQQQYEGLRMLL